MRLFLAVGVLALAAACAPRASLRPPENDAVHLTDVPFFPNTTDQCGPAALASVLHYWGKTATPEELKSEVYVPRLKGTLPMDLRPALSKRDLAGQVVSGSFDDIKAELRQSRPVIAYLDFGTRRHPIGHFLVVTGFDDHRRGLYVHSGAAKDKFASYRRFDRGWRDTDRWMLTAGPATSPTNAAPPVERRLPHIETQVSARDYFELGSAYQQKGLNQEAIAQYTLALAEYKNFSPALIALGNIAFEARDYHWAEKYYRRVLRADPAHGGANNNLAMVYLARGRDLKKAETLATKALETDYRPYAADTLAQIQERRAIKN